MLCGLMSKPLAAWVTALIMFCLLNISTVRSSAAELIWSEDAVPAGAVELPDGIDAWNWTAFASRCAPLTKKWGRT